MEKGVFRKRVLVFFAILLAYTYQVTHPPPLKIVVVFFLGFLAYAYQATRPPPPKICGSPDGPPVTGPRIKLRDGRHLAYKEFGVSKDHAKYKIVYIHGGDNCRHDFPLILTLSEGHMLFHLRPGYMRFVMAGKYKKLGIYVVSFDRPGYGESDPHPKRTHKTIAKDVEELADQLNLGSKFYLIGYSMGGQAVWHCLKYIPHRLAGAVLLAPAINFWWSFPAKLASEAFHQQPLPHQWAFRVLYYLPCLTYWWNTQQFFPSLSTYTTSIFSREDVELLPRVNSFRDGHRAQTRQQGDFESLYRDLIIGYGKDEVDPMKLENPFPNRDGLVHLWMAEEDTFVPIKLLRYIAHKLPWICSHKLHSAGHMFLYADGIGDRIIKSLLLDKCDVLYTST